MQAGKFTEMSMLPGSGGGPAPQKGNFEVEVQKLGVFRRAVRSFRSKLKNYIVFSLF